jgi:hypothetical protein
MEKNLSQNSREDYYIPSPENILMKPILQNPTNTPVSECSFMLKNFQKNCNCKGFKDQSLQDECHEIFNEIKDICFENKN